MFKRKKELGKMDIKLKQIQNEKEELLKIKELLDEQLPKLDISNVYVWEVDGISYIVKYSIKPIKMSCKASLGKITDGYCSKLINIFNDEIMYEKNSLLNIARNELIRDIDGTLTNRYAHLTPILEADKSLLIYADRKVPLYVLQQTYYRLNNTDIVKVKTLG